MVSLDEVIDIFEKGEFHDHADDLVPVIYRSEFCCPMLNLY